MHHKSLFEISLKMQKSWVAMMNTREMFLLDGAVR